MGAPFAERFGGAALVTGASAGIGACFARHLAEAKMDLILVARRRDRLEATARELAAAHGVRAEALDVDLAAPGATAELLRRVAATGLDVGLLVCSAGFGGYGPFVEADAANDARMVDLNCRVVVEHCHAFLPTPYWATYGATKAFNLMLGEALWAELSPHGVDVLALSPGYTKTEFQQAANIDFGVGPELDVNVVVAGALRALGKRPSTIPGLTNWLMTSTTRFVPRRLVARMSARMSHPRRFIKPTEPG
jgi:uncharacterized protein